jgi:beta-xylosidase
MNPACCTGAVLFCLGLVGACQGQSPATTHINDLSVHDPCILADPASQTYYIYRSFAPNRFGATSTGDTNRAGTQAFWSKDLTNWFGPTNVFEIPDGFWADKDSHPWAPEVHAFRGKYYLFTTFNAWREKLDERPGRPFINKRASQILVADRPLGPFRPFANQPHTPPGEMTLDATFWFEDGVPWLIYCHEWVQLGDGLIKAIRLRDDLSATVGAPITILNSGEVPWTKQRINYRGTNYPGVVTDGPYLWRTKNDKLLLLWSSWTPTNAYATAFAVSDSGKITGPWRHEPPEPILQDDRGHGMIFRDFNGRLLLSLHRYFHQPKTRVQLWELEDTGDTLRVKSQLLGTE